VSAKTRVSRTARDYVASNDDADAVIEYMAQMPDEAMDRRFFSVKFKDGNVRNRRAER
jgi:hypothetical protein